ncbi:MAG: zinc ribbon domain-containing protein [Steroidobacteraceae bacterium]
MPFYEYQCGSCGHYLEVLQKISDAPLKKCPDCGRSALKRLISAPVFRLKGGGWYETDFKSDKENKRNLAGSEESAGEAKAEAKPDEASKTESKAEPAAKAEPKKTVVAKPAAKAPAKPAKKAAAKPAAKKKARR